MLPTKRKRDVQQEIRSDKPPTGSLTREEESSKKKTRKRTKQIAEDPRDSGKKSGIDESIGKMNGRLLADFFAQQAKRHDDELTTVELNDIYVPGKRGFPVLI
jgi:hypothetical protein